MTAIFRLRGSKLFFYFSLDFSCMSRRRISIACLVPLIALCTAAVLDSRGRHSNKFSSLKQFRQIFKPKKCSLWIWAISFKRMYFNYVRTIGGRGGRQNAYKCVQRGGGCHPYVYVRNFSHMDPTKIRFSTIWNVADWSFPEKSCLCYPKVFI